MKKEKKKQCNLPQVGHTKGVNNFPLHNQPLA